MTRIKGKEYFFIHVLSDQILIDSYIEDGHPIDNKHYKMGNYFKTKNQAEKAKQAVLDIFKENKK